jgi:putative transposase
MLDFTGRHFTKLLILQALRWYLSYPLSYRHVEELMKERGVSVDHSTINRWVIKYARELEAPFSKKFRKYDAYVSWKMDETYLKHKGKDVYLYRAIDRFCRKLIKWVQYFQNQLSLDTVMLLLHKTDPKQSYYQH